MGWLEERLPFINIWLPEAFRARYPELERGLRSNENRLTTPWDVHVTLRDVLRAPWGGEDGERAVTAGPGCIACPRCASLFTPLPADRGCEDVAVDRHWCTCTEYNTLSTEDRTARGAAQYVARFISEKLAAAARAAGGGAAFGGNLTSPGWHCANLSLQRVKSVRGRQAEKEGDVQDFIVIFETTPGSAVFEATVRISHAIAPKSGDKANATYDLLGSISRINEFWEHSQCIHSADLKKYCHCTRDPRRGGSRKSG